MDKGQKWMVDVKVALVMVMVQAAAAGVNIFYKVAANDGMDVRILLAYRFLFATAFFIPVAFVLERKNNPKITLKVLGQSFLCGLLGGPLSQILYLQGLVLTSVTFASVMANLIPAITYILAVCFGLEKMALRASFGKAKLIGTLLGISGAMVLTFYKGTAITLWSANIHIGQQHGGQPMAPVPPPSSTHQIFGGLLCLASSVAFAGWFIVQAKMSKDFPHFYSSTALMSLMACVQSFFIALVVNHDMESWKLGWNLRLLSVSYIGIVSGLALSVSTWCMTLRGPLFASAFAPVMLIMVALCDSLLLNEKLYLGSLIGGLIIMGGLYVVLWGKMKEMKAMNQSAPSAKEGDHKADNITTSEEEGSKGKNGKQGSFNGEERQVDIESLQEE